MDASLWADEAYSQGDLVGAAEAAEEEARRWTARAEEEARKRGKGRGVEEILADAREQQRRLDQLAVEYTALRARRRQRAVDDAVQRNVASAESCAQSDPAAAAALIVTCFRLLEEEAAEGGVEWGSAWRA
eukprot:Hpha_TRINITY_DN28308_c0_g1::TRINITY_DN28308_c0_g1_i1::g.2265::m.2265